MAAFPYQYQQQPFIVDSAYFTNINISSIDQPLHIINTSLPFLSVINHETSCLHQNSNNSLSDHNNPSPQSSMVVDKLEKGEQVTQKVSSMENKKRIRNKSSLSSPLSKDSIEGRSKKQKKSSGEGMKREDKKKEEKKDQKKILEEPPTGYIHVRARRGQATDSHSLAERVRREKISDRMKILQQLVPGCDKVNGKALVLDEIINYVQSLQNQVEVMFLSMKLASVNPIFFDLAIDLDHQSLNSITSQPSPSTTPLPSLPLSNSNHATPFADTITTTFHHVNNDYLLEYPNPMFLQGQSKMVDHFGTQKSNDKSILIHMDLATIHVP
ncbi:uncharacterized protein [Cicer arietinum]|uniref:Transcription factor bHLH137-like isoform X2 n=1 Tax=Cicer arietinum TaxID=3827 RepID=A0A1S2YEW2_CICAR|nr:transcription factor bHLH137-like isoform X2 [Cicer arietinum]